jgi:single-stranded DNA-binding protein
VRADLKAGREVAVDGRLLFDEFQTQDGGYASRVYIVAERVEFLASRKAPNGQADAPPDKPAEGGVAREAHRTA